MSSTWFFWLRVFSERFEGFESVIPEPVKISAQAFDAGRVQLVDAAVSDLVIENEVGVLEHTQVLRDRRPANRESLGDLVDGGRPFGQALENGQPGWISQRDQLLHTVSHHLR
jgi:hypothetical protein